MKVLLPILWFVVLLLCGAACNKPKSAMVSTPNENLGSIKPPQLLSQAQIDSFLLFQGKAIPASLWALVFEESPVEAEVFVLSGNLDQDPEQELVLWYYWEAMRAMGELCLLDPKPNGWKKNGPEYLDFFRGTTPPLIDTLQKMLLTYSYGSGSGFGSEVLNFYQNDEDSLVCVFRLLEREFLAWPGCDAFRSIDTQYSFKDSSQILATFRYELRATEYNAHPGKLIFQQKLSIPFVWDATQKRFAPILPEGFPPLDNAEGFLDYGEPSFDVFYEADLEKIKKHGPRWKQEALCNPARD